VSDTLDRPACLYCHRALPVNDVVELFPFGRRVAIDSRRNRYWVICSRCRKWNLAPLDDASRGVTIEFFERWWTRSTTRYSEGGIGLGRFSKSLEVVRVGDADWADFAGWRHADGLKARRFWRVGREMVAVVGSISLWSAGVLSGPTVIGVIASMPAVSLFMRQPRLTGRRAVCRVDTGDGRPWVRQGHLRHLELVAGRDDWALNVAHERGVCRLIESSATSVLSYALPRINYYGGTTASIREGLAIIRDAGGHDRVLRSAAARLWNGSSTRHKQIAQLPAAARMALELAVQENRERSMAAAEIHRLRQEWHEAAAVADRMQGATNNAAQA
jgi:hypothetical protein